MRLLDRDGLVSPETLPYLRSGLPLQLLLDYDPDWVVTSDAAINYNEFTDSAIFHDHYALEQRFGIGDGSAYELWRAKGE
jgi:hypothetical protein